MPKKDLQIENDIQEHAKACDCSADCRGCITDFFLGTATNDKSQIGRGGAKSLLQDIRRSRCDFFDSATSVLK